MRYVATAGIAGLMVLGISAGARGTELTSTYVQQCIDKWQDAPAYSYCSSASVTRIASSATSDGGKCVVEGSCSVTVTVGDDERTWTPGVNLTLKKRRTDDIDICFWFTTTDGGTVEPRWNLSVKKVCDSADTTIADAVANGLPDGSLEALIGQ